MSILSFLQSIGNVAGDAYKGVGNMFSDTGAYGSYSGRQLPSSTIPLMSAQNSAPAKPTSLADLINSPWFTAGSMRDSGGSSAMQYAQAPQLPSNHVQMSNPMNELMALSNLARGMNQQKQPYQNVTLEQLLQSLRM